MKITTDPVSLALEGLEMVYNAFHGPVGDFPVGPPGEKGLERASLATVAADMGTDLPLRDFRQVVADVKKTLTAMKAGDMTREGARTQIMDAVSTINVDALEKIPGKTQDWMLRIYPGEQKLLMESAADANRISGTVHQGCCKLAEAVLTHEQSQQQPGKKSIRTFLAEAVGAVKDMVKGQNQGQGR